LEPEEGEEVYLLAQHLALVLAPHRAHRQVHRQVFLLAQHRALVPAQTQE